MLEQYFKELRQSEQFSLGGRDIKLTEYRQEQIANSEKEALELLKESKLQIEYLQKKFQETGTGNSFLSRLGTFIDKLEFKENES